MQRTNIEWTDFSANPIKLRLPDGRLVNACVKCSTGCAHCYAEKITNHWWPKAAGKFPGYSLPILNAGEIVISDTELSKMLRARPRPKPPYRNGERPLCFIGDMTDIFGDWVPFELLDRLFAVFALRPDITFQVLTKRPERMAEYLLTRFRTARVSERACMMGTADQRASLVEPNFRPWPFPNVWLGCSVENQQAADERIPHLLKCPAAVRFLSVEPMIGPVEFSDVSQRSDALAQLGKKALSGIDWTIVGGESGHGARPMHPDWTRSIRDQCKAAGVAFFFKQWGEWMNAEAAGYPELSDESVNKSRRALITLDGLQCNTATIPAGKSYDAKIMMRVGKKAAGRLLDGVEHNEFPKATVTA